MSDYFQFDSYAVLAEVKNRKLPQPNRNSKQGANPCDTSKTASTAKTATALPNSASFFQPEGCSEDSSEGGHHTFLNTNISNAYKECSDMDIERTKKAKNESMPAVVAVSAVPQTGWQKLEKSSCGSVAEVAVLSDQSTSTTSDATSVPKLTSFQNRAINAGSLNKLYLVLADFARHDWSLSERQDMSNEYTPRALQLIEGSNADKYQTLEDLAELCWRKE